MTSLSELASVHHKLRGGMSFPRGLMSVTSSTVPSSPIVSIATMGGGGGARGPLVTSSGGGPGGKCCENGRPVSTDPMTGQTICSCQYNPGALLMAAGCYPRGVGMGVPGLEGSVYSSPYAAMQGLLPSAPGAEHAAFYSSMGAIQGTAGYYAYDPFGAYPYGNGFSMDPNARRKNATRESTQTLKAWLSEHRKNPYPTKGEKIMLAIITKMTLTQVSTWFANARRRLKKENKMTWSPRNRCGDEDDDMDDDDDDNKLNGDDNDTNNNRDFADDTSENNDIDILDCDDSLVLGHDSDYSKSRTNIGDDGARDINVLDDDDSSAPSGHDSSDKVNTSLGSAFTLVSPSSRLSQRSNDHSPSRSTSPRPHPSLSHIDNERMRNGHHILNKMTSPGASPVTSLKPKIWSVADVMVKSSRDEEAERPRSPSRSPVHQGQGPLHGQHPPHPAFPTPPGAQNPSLSMARSMALWNPSVTSLAGRYHPYGIGQGLFSMAHPGGAAAAISTSRGPFPGHALPSAMVPGLMGGHHPPGHHPHGISLHTGALNPSSLPTDLRKVSPGSASMGRTLNGSPDRKSMTSPADVIKSREGSPLVPTAFKPVARSS